MSALSTSADTTRGIPFFRMHLEFLALFTQSEKQISDGDFLVDKNTEQSESGICIQLRARLADFLERQQVSMRSYTSHERYLFQRVQYANCCLIDELILAQSKWPGSHRWGTYLLEKRLFDTAMAGQTLFDHIDELLDQREHSEAQIACARVYLSILQIGFQGKYRNAVETRALARYRRKLIEYIGLTADEDFHQKFFASAYATDRTADSIDGVIPKSRINRIYYTAIGLLIGLNALISIIYVVNVLTLTAKNG